MSPKAVPMLRDADEVFRGIVRVPGVVYVALIPNARGAERAIEAGVDEFNFVMSASESHNRANMRMSTAQSLEALRGIMDLTRGVAGQQACVARNVVRLSVRGQGRARPRARFRRVIWSLASPASRS